MSKLWGGIYKKPAFWDEAAEWLIESSELPPGSDVLDVGTGSGGTLFPALERIGEAGRIIGIEIAKDSVERVKKAIAERGISNAEVLLMNAHSMSFPDAGFDVAIAGMVGLAENYDFDTGETIEGAPMIREIFRVLRPGGRLYMSNWLWQEETEWMSRLVRRHLHGCSKRGYWPGTEEGYVDVLGGAGFQDVRTTPMKGSYAFDDPADWMAGMDYMWKEELDRIRAQPEVLRAFEQDALALLADQVDEHGKIVYTRSALIVSARKPSSS